MRMEDEIREIIADDEVIIPIVLLNAICSTPLDCSSDSDSDSSSCACIAFHSFNRKGIHSSRLDNSQQRAQLMILYDRSE